MSDPQLPDPDSHVSRRSLMSAALAAAALAAATSADAQEKPAADERRSSPKKFDMKKSINLWAFPYPQRMNLEECLTLAKQAGFDFFFQAEDGIRDLTVTGVQTCALPI